MTLLSHQKLVQLAETGVIGPVKHGAINADQYALATEIEAKWGE